MKAGKRLLAIGLLILPVSLPAQWARYGGSGKPHSLLEAADGDWVIASDKRVIKLSGAGEVIWGKTLGSATDDVSSTKAWLSPDGGVVVAGYDSPAWMLFKLSAGGDVVWQKAYVLDGAIIDAFSPMADGGALLAGRIGSDLLLCRCSAEGRIAWQMSCGTEGIDLFAAAAATADGGLVVLGSTVPVSGEIPLTDLWVLKLGAAGEIEWQKRVGGAADDVGEAVYQTGDGGYLIAGHSASFAEDGLSRFWLMKLSEGGEVLRQRTLDHEYRGFGWFSMRPSAEGTFIAALQSSFPGRTEGLAVVTILADGSVAREAAYSPAGRVLAALPTGDAGVLVAIQGSDDSTVMKLLPSGEIEWQKTYGSQYADDVVSLAHRLEDGGYILAGETDSWGGYDYLNALWIMRTAPDGSIGPNCYFVREGNESRREDLSTRADVAAAIKATAVVPQSAAFRADDANIAFGPLGPTTLPALGGPMSQLTVKVTVVREGSYTGEGTVFGTVTPALGQHTYATGTSVNIGCTMNEGYEFLEWSCNIRLKQRTAAIVMDGDKTIDLWVNYAGKGIEKVANEMCFVATAAYGDPSHPDVEVLRRFRDRYLMRSRAGRAFVDLYYRYSAAPARFVAKRPALRALSRAVLGPVVTLSRLLLGLVPGGR
jgi:hypothetical protein